MRRFRIPAGLILALGLFAPAPQAQQEVFRSLHVKAPEFPPPSAPGASLPGARAEGGGSPPTMGGDSDSGDEDMEAGIVWFNSSPLTLAALRGKVVLIDFWNYANINSLRTLPQIKTWWERYHPYGFEVVGVHDPEFDFGYSPSAVREAARRLGLRYPIAIDDGFAISKAYQNNGWPNRFLIDAGGTIRFNRPGEGGNDQFEHAIQDLLLEAHPELQFPPTYTMPTDVNAAAPACGAATRPIYVGDWRGHGALANAEGYHDRERIDYKMPDSVEDGRTALAGRWEADRSGMIYRGKHKGNEPGEDRATLRYHAREVYAVMNVVHGHPSRIYVTQDGKPLTAADKGVDVQIDAQGRSYVEVRQARLYYLVQNPAFGSHSVDLFPTAQGLALNMFSFGNDCQVAFDHL
ncbi:MAG TPA: redoxin domain-containing protein [Terriglobia bacterium]|nr:redoxin domain-containing protein [Terriglobia bacterium]